MKLYNLISIIFFVLWGNACSISYPLLEQAHFPGAEHQVYRMGVGDSLKVEVWDNLDLSAVVPVRPDGKVTLPLIQDIHAEGKMPEEFARSVEVALKAYIHDPIVTVTVLSFSGVFYDKLSVLGEVKAPQSVSYRRGMTLLDLMVQVGGLSEFAAGNRATLIRRVNGEQKQYRVRLYDLLKQGDVSANAPVYPGDVLIIPEAYF